MGSVSTSLDRSNLHQPREGEVYSQFVRIAALARKYRLTLLFAITAILLTAAAAMVVNIVVGNLAENNLIRIAEENTARDGLHIQSMMRGGHSMDGLDSAGVIHDQTTQNVDRSMPHIILSQPLERQMPKNPWPTCNNLNR